MCFKLKFFQLTNNIFLNFNKELSKASLRSSHSRQSMSPKPKDSLSNLVCLFTKKTCFKIIKFI